MHVNGGHRAAVFSWLKHLVAITGKGRGPLAIAMRHMLHAQFRSREYLCHSSRFIAQAYEFAAVCRANVPLTAALVH